MCDGLTCCPCSYIPYTWRFDIRVDDVDVLVALNEHNWLDTTSELSRHCELISHTRWSSISVRGEQGVYRNMAYAITILVYFR
ncbi:unnamed protein product [Sphagnum balticum]